MTDKEKNNIDVVEKGTSHKNIKAYYPHIVVTGTIQKPCYSIEWFDIATQQMMHGYSSYYLGYVREWLECYFEDIGDIDKLLENYTAKIETLTMENQQLQDDIVNANQNYEHIKELWQNEKKKLIKINNKLIAAYRKIYFLKNKRIADIGKMIGEAKNDILRKISNATDHIVESNNMDMLQRTSDNNVRDNYGKWIPSGDGADAPCVCSICMKTSVHKLKQCPFCGAVNSCTV